MEITSISFLLLAFLTVLVLNGFRNFIWRRYLLFAANLVFLAGVATDPIQVIPLAIFLGIGYILLLGQYHSRLRHSLGLSISLIIVLFVVLKRYAIVEFVPALPFLYSVVGLSYILFRLLHLLIDVKEGALARVPSPIEYVNYMCFFLSFLSGPIQRFQDFEAQELASANHQHTKESVEKALRRIILGFLKVILVCGLFAQTQYFSDGFLTFISTTSNPLDIVWIVRFATACTLYTLFLYFNFSGYMDVVIGVGAMFGFYLPENFQRPFEAKNFLDFWARWHITLSNWFRTYLFNPLLKVLVSHCSNQKLLPYLGVMVFFVTFLVMGLWHGTSRIFFFYGVFLGFGVSVNKLFQITMQRKFWKQRYLRFRSSVFIQHCSRGLTFSYFALALTCLWTDQNLLRLLGSERGMLAGCGALLVVWLVATLMLPTVSSLRQIMARWPGDVAFFSSPVMRNVPMAIQVLLVLTGLAVLQNQVVFVYKAF